MGFFSKVFSGASEPAVLPEHQIRLQLAPEWLKRLENCLVETGRSGPLDVAKSDIQSLVHSLAAISTAPLDTDWQHWVRPPRFHTKAEDLAFQREREAEARKPVVVVGVQSEPEVCTQYKVPTPNEITEENCWRMVKTVALALREANSPKSVVDLSTVLHTVQSRLSNGDAPAAPQSRL